MLSVFIAVAAAAPSGLHYGAVPYAAYDVPEYHVSNIVEHVPTAVSHQSRVDYHSKPLITPVYNTVLKAYHQPAYLHSEVHSAPIVAHHAPIVAHSAPIYEHAW